MNWNCYNGIRGDAALTIEHQQLCCGYVLSDDAGITEPKQPKVPKIC